MLFAVDRLAQLAVSNPGMASTRVIAPRQLLQEADGRSIIIGENHGNRGDLQTILAVMRIADQQGYKILGVEVSEQGFESGQEKYRGLVTEIQYIRSFGDKQMPERDEMGYIEIKPGERLRMNRQFQIQLALKLGWKIIAVDPNHWDWHHFPGVKHFERREPKMIQKIQPLGSKKAIIVVGNAHLGGLVNPIVGNHKLNSRDFILVNATPPQDPTRVAPQGQTAIEVLLRNREKFTGQLPLLQL